MKEVRCYILENPEGDLLPAYCGHSPIIVKEFAATGLGMGEWPNISRIGYKVVKCAIKKIR